MPSRRRMLASPERVSRVNRAVLSIDMQRAIFDGLGGKHQAMIDGALDRMLAGVATMQRAARARGIPVVHVQHEGTPGHRLAHGGLGWEIRPEVAPVANEPVVAKQYCDAFFGTKLSELLTSAG